MMNKVKQTFHNSDANSQCQYLITTPIDLIVNGSLNDKSMIKHVYDKYMHT